MASASGREGAGLCYVAVKTKDQSWSFLLFIREGKTPNCPCAAWQPTTQEKKQISNNTVDVLWPTNHLQLAGPVSPNGYKYI